jgi:hypothetical protein
MSIEPEAQDARQQIVQAARDMLSGSLSFIEGGRLITRLSWSADLPEFDPDIVPFRAIDSETDALPMRDVRQYWAPEALAKLQPEIERAEEWARDTGRPSCQKLIDRFGTGTD